MCKEADDETSLKTALTYMNGGQDCYSNFNFRTGKMESIPSSVEIKESPFINECVDRLVNVKISTNTNTNGGALLKHFSAKKTTSEPPAEEVDVSRSGNEPALTPEERKYLRERLPPGFQVRMFINYIQYTR